MNNRDCIHGRQIGKCPECDAIALEPELDQLRTRIAELEELSVTNIHMRTNPGFNGMGHEVFAESVDEVVTELTKLSSKNAELEAENARLKDEALTANGYANNYKQTYLHKCDQLRAVELHEAGLREALERLLCANAGYEIARTTQKDQLQKAAYELVEAEKSSQQALNSTPPDLSEVEAMRRDAERYRWLRDNNTGRALSVSALSWNGDPNHADSAIDAAMLAAWDSHEHD